MKKNIILTFIILIFIFAGCNKNDKPQEKKIIKIGAVLPLTGDVASYGKDSKDGIDLSISLANKFQNKYEFKVIYMDSKGEPKTAVNVLQQLLSFDKPIAIIGDNLSSTTAAMIQIIDQNKILLISPSASAPNLSGLSKYFFRVFPSDIEEGTFICNYISKELPNSKVCIIYVNNDYGIGLKDVFEKISLKNNLNILGTFAIAKGSSEFRTILTKIIKLNPDVIYMPCYYQEGGLLVKQIKELGITSKLFGSTTQEDPKFIELAGKASEGFIIPVSTGYDSDSKDTTIKKFISNYTKVYKKEPGLVSALGYDCSKLLIDGILNNFLSSISLREYILKSKDISGAAGTMNFDENGDVHKTIVLKKIINKKFE